MPGISARPPGHRKCVFCGCTGYAACNTPDGPYHWLTHPDAERQICSNETCVAKAIAEDKRRNPVLRWRDIFGITA